MPASNPKKPRKVHCICAIQDLRHTCTLLHPFNVSTFCTNSEEKSGEAASVVTANRPASPCQCQLVGPSLRDRRECQPSARFPDPRPQFYKIMPTISRFRTHDFYKPRPRFYNSAHTISINRAHDFYKPCPRLSQTVPTVSTSHTHGITTLAFSQFWVTGYAVDSTNHNW